MELPEDILLNHFYSNPELYPYLARLSKESREFANRRETLVAVYREWLYRYCLKPPTQEEILDTYLDHGSYFNITPTSDIILSVINIHYEFAHRPLVTYERYILDHDNHQIRYESEIIGSRRQYFDEHDLFKYNTSEPEPYIYYLILRQRSDCYDIFPNYAIDQTMKVTEKNFDKLFNIAYKYEHYKDITKPIIAYANSMRYINPPDIQSYETLDTLSDIIYEMLNKFYDFLVTVDEESDSEAKMHVYDFE